MTDVASRHWRAAPRFSRLAREQSLLDLGMISVSARLGLASLQELNRPETPYDLRGKLGR